MTFLTHYSHKSLPRKAKWAVDGVRCTYAIITTLHSIQWMPKCFLILSFRFCSYKLVQSEKGKARMIVSHHSNIISHSLDLQSWHTTCSICDIYHWNPSILLKALSAFCWVNCSVPKFNIGKLPWDSEQPHSELRKGTTQTNKRIFQSIKGW